MAWSSPEKARAYNRAYYRDKNVVQRRRNAWLVRMYGITQADYERMVEQQNGVCGICHKPDPRDFPLAVDHDHNTNVVRGLLCLNCNVNLGWYEKRSEGIREYLRDLPSRLAA